MDSIDSGPLNSLKVHIKIFSMSGQNFFFEFPRTLFLKAKFLQGHDKYQSFSALVYIGKSFHKFRKENIGSQ